MDMLCALVSKLLPFRENIELWYENKDFLKWTSAEILEFFQSRSNAKERGSHIAFFKATMKGDLQKVKSILYNNPYVDELINSDNELGWNSVFVAMYAGHADVLKYLLDMGAEIESPGTRYYGLLSAACRLGRMEVIPVLLQYGADPYVINHFGLTCLHTIAKVGDVKMAEMIFDKDHKPDKILNMKDKFDSSPLHYAIAADNIDLCRWLINRGADVKGRGPKEDTPFIAACLHGNLGIMGLFLPQDLSKRYKVLNDRDVDGKNGLHCAVSENNIEAAMAIISWGADVNCATNEGSTALHICAAFGFSTLVKVLIQSGAQVNAIDRKSKTPLHRAAECHQTDTLTALIHQGAGINDANAEGWTALFTACSKGFVDVVEKLLAFRADFMCTDYTGKSCLMAAIEEKHWGVVQLLLKRCSRSLVLLRDMTEKTALHQAAALKDKRFVKALLPYEELINAQDLSGELPLHYAARFGNCSTLKILAEVADDMDAETHDVKTPLIFACEKGQCQCASLLIQMGADVNHRILNSYNTLMIATSSGSTSLVEELIRSGVKVNSINHEKNTALHLACGAGHLDIVRTLIEQGASVKAINRFGETPLLVAVQQSQEEVATFLVKHRSWEESMSVDDPNGLLCFVKMTAQTPKAAKVVLDNCLVTSRHSQKDINFKSMIENNREDLLSHPVCQAFLVYKWNTFGRYYLMLNVMMQALFFVFALIYLHAVPRLEANQTDDGCNIPPTPTSNNSMNMSMNKSLYDTKYMSSERQAYDDRLVITSVIGMVVTLCFVVFKEIRFLCASGLWYLNSGQFITTVLAASFILGSFYPFGYYPCSLQWRLLAVGMTIYSYASSIVFNRVDNIGIYFSMFYEVLQTILKMAVVLIFFVLTMAIPLKIFLRLETGFTDYDPFPISALAMMVGELNYRDIFVNGDTNPFRVDSLVYFPVFVLVLNITFMNMMIGAAVGDIENVEKRAYLTRLRSQVTFLEEMEATFVGAMREKFCRDSYVVFPNGKSGKWMKLIKRFTSYDNMMFIKKDEDFDKVEQLTEVVNQQNEQLKQLKEMTLSMRDELMLLTRRHKLHSSHTQQSEDECEDLRSRIITNVAGIETSRL